MVSLVAVPAAAHPFVSGGEVAVDSLASITLAMAHGCESETDDGGAPTHEVALEVPEQMRVIDVADHDRYQPAVEEVADGRVETVTWTATDGGIPAPEFDLDVVASGEPGDELHLRVVQACEGFTYRWIGTPQQPADNPAVTVSLTEPDLANPPPSEYDAPSGTETEGAQQETRAPQDPNDTPSEEAGQGEDPSTSTNDEDNEDNRASAGAATNSDENDSSSTGLLFIAGLLPFMLVGVAIFATRRRPRSRTEPPS